MLPAAARLRNHRDFTAVVRSGARAGRSALTVHLAEGGQSDGARARVGFVVGRSLGNAVARNRVRRQLRHIVRERLARLDERAPGSRLVIRALPPAATATSTELAAAFDAALDRALAVSTRVPARAPGAGGSQ
ncbi:MAG: ribonuclease protein component [Frankiales bacterium]|nr:ribonuclease protein component [Frankiales bacterium]